MNKVVHVDFHFDDGRIITSEDPSTCAAAGALLAAKIAVELDRRKTAAAKAPTKTQPQEGRYVATDGPSCHKPQGKNSQWRKQARPESRKR